MNNQKCHQCSSHQYKIIKMPDNSPHAYKKVCSGCDRYISWVSRGEVNYTEMISTIDLSKLSEKEHKFITISIQNCMIKGYDLTIKQTQWLDSILKKYKI